jgi:hypothetical protein
VFQPSIPAEVSMLYGMVAKRYKFLKTETAVRPQG